jgi:hypothetical protein
MANGEKKEKPKKKVRVKPAPANGSAPVQAHEKGGSVKTTPYVYGK